MSFPTIKFKIREALAVVAMAALGLALVVQHASNVRTVDRLKQRIYSQNATQTFREFMGVTLGELGLLIIKEPQEAQLHLVSAVEQETKMDGCTPRDILSRISLRKGFQLPVELGAALLAEFTPDSVDYQASYFDPEPLAALQFVRRGDTLLIISGNEAGRQYAKVIVVDSEGNCKNGNLAWFRFDSALIRKTVGAQSRTH
jgi:hypothetical protein